ncbi:Non-structural maintenance of chromosomes element 1 like protein [Termitomyces sp. J132]|nr:Non-structural maintenance of chromosomes element 1 like protein [Termitomyces sp. J132]
MASVSSDDVQRVFIQAILSRAIVSRNLAQILWEKSIDAVNAAKPELELRLPTGRDAWDEFVTKINRSLDSLDLEFRHLHDENSGTQMYALVNRKGDEIAQMATEYTAAEIAFFKAIVELIMLAPRHSFSVSSTAALREVSAIRPKTNMSKSQAEAVLGSFVAQKWLTKSKRGRYSLSTRSLLELSPYLKTTYPEELIECTICLEVRYAFKYHVPPFWKTARRGCTDTVLQTSDAAKIHVPPAGSIGQRITLTKLLFLSAKSQSQSQSQPQPKARRAQRTKKTNVVQDDIDIDEEEDAEPVKKEKAPARRTTPRITTN